MATFSVTRVWPLEKYARFIPEEQVEVLPQKESGSKKGGNWKHYQSSGDCHIQMSLLESNHLMISSGTQIYESFSLWNSQKWIKGVTKGDSILFIYKLNDQNRRFRIKFAQTSSSSSSEACRNCITSLAPLLPIREMDTGSANTITDSQLPSGYEDSQMLSQQTFSTQQMVPDPQPELALMNTQHRPPSGSRELAGNCPGQPTLTRRRYQSLDNNDSGRSSNSVEQPDDLISVPSLAKSLTEGKPLGLAYASTNFPTEQLGAFIRLCLTDSNFPGFVEEVEREMNSINN